ncbi:13888_t:CDS:2, partial [Dentiscutata erythropus]
MEPSATLTINGNSDSGAPGHGESWAFISVHDGIIVEGLKSIDLIDNKIRSEEGK